MPDFNQMTELNVGLLLFAALLSLVLLIGGRFEEKKVFPFMRYFDLMLLADIAMLLGEAGIWYFSGNTAALPLLKLCTLFSYTGGYVLLACYGYLQVGFIRTREPASIMPIHVITGLCVLAMGLTVCSLYSGTLFYFDEHAELCYTQYYWFLVLLDLAAAVLQIGLVIRHWRILGTKTALLLSCVSSLPIFALRLQIIWDSTPMYMMMSLSLLLVYILFHAELSRQLIRTEKELVHSQISVMLSQIQPHFLYNTLTSIHYLCGKDTKSAQKAIEEFSAYLRANMNALQAVSLIPFAKELEHVQTYLKLEKMRFDEELQVVYQIAAKDFFLPALTVQPLVENAVKHGLGAKESGGTVTIRTSETATHFLVEIEDDGVGFDVQQAPSHIGMDNVRKRLAAMCGGTLRIESEIGKGTKAVITIPKGDNDEDTCGR